MRLSNRDMIATGLVFAAVVLWALWLADASPPGLASVRATTAAVLALGFIASAAAVVPTFIQLLHGDKLYLVITSGLGVVALAGGVLALTTGSAAGLLVVVVSTVVLWLIATLHHRHQEGPARPPRLT